MDVGKEKTVMLSTHIMQEVEAICKRVIIIDKGKIVADDSTNEIMAFASVGKQDVVVEFVEKVAEDELKSIDGISSVLSIAGNTWVLTSSLSNDLLPNIFRFAVEKCYTIITMQRKSRQMEEVFQQLTSNSN